MGNYTIFLKFENPRRGRQARNFSENDPKFLDLKSSSEIFRKLSLGAPEIILSIIPRGFATQSQFSGSDFRVLARSQYNSSLRIVNLF